MLPLVAFLTLQSRPVTAFVAECSQAILKIDEGTWEADHTVGLDTVLKAQIARKGRVSLTTFSNGDRNSGQILIRPQSVLMVDHSGRHVQRYTPPSDASDKPAPLPPLEEGEFKFDLDTQKGLILRSNPDFVDIEVTTANGIDTLSAVVRKTDGKEAKLVLERDAKTCLPRDLSFATPTHRLRIHYSFEARKVADRELEIDPKSYEGYEESKPPSTPKRM